MSLKNFKTLKVLGQGSYGVVQKVLRYDDDQHYALKKVKYMDLKEKDKKNALNQIRILASINHPNIIKYKEAFFDENERVLCTVMQLAHNGDLSAKIKNKIKNNFYFYQYEIWSVGRDLINGLCQLHDKNIIHRDIKPANIFFGDKDVAKIGDMNVSILINHKFAYTQTGTPYYASPQVWDNHPYSFQCDIWSLGCVFYEMCALRKPFQGKSIQKLYEKIRKLKYDPLPCRFSADLIDVIRKCLTTKDKRISLHELKRIFQLHNPPKFQLQVQTKNEGKSLIDTIKLPLNKNDFVKCLPKSKYSDLEQTQNSSQESYPILNNFMISNQNKLSNRCYFYKPQLQRRQEPLKKQISLIQLNNPSFKKILQINSPPKYSIKQQKMIFDPLKLKRRKIQITQGR